MGVVRGGVGGIEILRVWVGTEVRVDGEEVGMGVISVPVQVL